MFPCLGCCPFQIPFEIRRLVGGKGLECVVCGKVFNRLLKLKQHHRTHTGERPWGCNKCGKAFNTAAYLQNHRQSCHTPAHQQQFSCCKLHCSGMQGRPTIIWNSNYQKLPGKFCIEQVNQKNLKDRTFCSINECISVDIQFFVFYLSLIFSYMPIYLYNIFPHM